MYGEKKKKNIILIIVLLGIFVGISPASKHITLYFEAKTWIKYFEDKDEKGLLKLFCSDIKINHREKTLEEINDAFKFIDGDIIKYDYRGEGSGGESVQGCRTEYFYYHPEYRVKTNTGKKYKIIFSCNYVCKDRPEIEGIEWIWIIEYDGNKEYSEVYIGEEYEFDK